MDVKILLTLPEEEHLNEIQKRSQNKNSENEPTDFVQMPSTIKTILDEIKNPQAQPAYKPSEKKPWVYHGTRRRLFNSNAYATFTLRLNTLQNLKTKSTESVGDYMVSVFFKGRLYGAFLSGAVDLESLTGLTRHKKRCPTYLHCPKVTLGHEVKLHLRFKDMVDNPVVLALTSTEESFSEKLTLGEPFAYTCLNVINLVRKGKQKDLLRPWYCVQGKTPVGILLGFPFIDLEVMSFGGLPNSEQLKQGNIMSVVIESMYRLPPEIQGMTNQNSNEMEVFITLPHSLSENTFHFPGGMLEKLIPPVVADVLEKSNLNEQGEGDGINAVPGSKIRVQPTGIINQSNGIPVFLEQKNGAHRHWASIQEYYPDAPRGASVVTGKKRIIKLTHDKHCLAGDVGETGDTSWKGYLNSSDTRLVWNSLRRHYMGLEAYKQMLERLAKHVIWPLEIAVTVRREKVQPPAKKVTSNSSIPKKDGSVSKKDGSIYKKDGSISKKDGSVSKKEGSISKKGPSSESDGVTNTNNDRSNSRDGDGEPQFEIVVIYHGVAFVDMTKLLHPGVKRAHYACRLYTFNEAVFMATTCTLKSAFLSSLNTSIINLASDDAKRQASISQGRNEKDKPKSPIGNQIVDNKKTRKSEATKKDGPAKPSSLQTVSTDEPVKKPKHKSSMPQLHIDETLKTSSLDDSANFPFIVFQIRMNRALVPPIARDKNGVHKCVSDYLPMRRFPRKRLMNSTLAQKKYRNSVLEAAAELSHQFHDEYLDYIVKEGVSRAYLDPRSPSSSFENIKKGFLFYLNASGRYLVLREHLRFAVSDIIQQKCTNLQPKGFKSRREFQNFLHDMYLFLVDEMYGILNTTALQEVDPLATRNDTSGSKNHVLANQGRDQTKKCKQSEHSKKGWIGVQNLLMFAQESFAQCDYENSHRLHVERVARSGESSECWADFGIMWLSRGDDRLAEIAIRESLIKNEKNLKALIISGIIAARHNDSRAITCLGAALRLRPISPEILVLIGAAHACLGNDCASEYFFKKARFVHHLLTGKDTNTINQEFSTISARWDMAEAVTSLENIYPKRRLTIRQEQVTVVSPPVLVPDVVVQVEKDHKHSGSLIEENKSKRKSRHSRLPHHKETNEISETGGLHGLLEDAHVQSNSVTHRPQYQFPVEELVIKNRKAIKFAKLPSMGPSITQVWNVTKFTKRFKSKQWKSSLVDNNQDDPKKGSLDKFLESEKLLQMQTFGQSLEEIENNEFEDESEGRNESMYGEEYLEAYTDEYNESDFQPEPSQFNVFPEAEKPVDVKKKKTMKIPDKVISRRVGSEYIWTAHVLLKLRLFDFLDGILARELTFHEKREIPFLYIRAVSLHLRQRDLEALDFINESIEIHPNNPILWALKGHCYYNLHDTEPALQSYERALKLPHGHENMQLVYLRFGSLCLEKGNVTLAKKIFLKGVHYFPSPYMWMAAGNICYHLKEYSQAETAFAEANRLDNTNPIIWAHLSLVSLAKGHKTLAEQSYKWAIRFGLKKCRLMDEIKELHRNKGFGNPGFPRIPHCIPHDYYMKRLGRDRPFEEYKEALKFPKPKHKKHKHSNTHREKELIKKLKAKAQEKLEILKETEKQVSLEPDQSVLSGGVHPVPSGVIIPFDVPITQKISVKAIPHESKGKKGKTEGKTARTAPVAGSSNKSNNVIGEQRSRRKSSQK